MNSYEAIASVPRRAWHLVRPLLSRQAALVRAGNLASALWFLPWQAKVDPRRVRLILTAKQRSQLTIRGLVNVLKVTEAASAQGIEGAFVECGVWKGGAASVMAYTAIHQGSVRRLFLFDSWEGMPEATASDSIGGEAAIFLSNNRFSGALAPVGTNVADLDEVKQFFFERLAVPRDLVTFKKGWFQDTIPRARDEIGPIAVLRIDGDWYESTKVCLDYLFDQVVSGGYVIIDDYGYFPGCKLAVDEFLERRALSVELKKVDYGVRYFRKPRSDQVSSLNEK